MWRNVFFSALLWLSAIVCVAACRQIAEPFSTPPVVSVDLQSGFNRDVVRITLNGQLVYDDTTTTSVALGLARQVEPATLRRGSHRIQVSILNEGISADTTFFLGDTLTVAVNFKRNEGKLLFALYRFLIYYR